MSMILPAISTIEFTNACNFNCHYCQRTNEDGLRKNGMLSVPLVKAMALRGDFANTVYTEFQQNGEPTIHPKFNELVEVVKSVVPYVGMSTNASFMKFKHNPIEGVKLMDCITISVHEETKQEEIEDVLNALKNTKVRVRVQTLNNQVHSINVDKLKNEYGVFVDDYEIREWQTDYGHKDFCIDVKTSVTIQYDGDVVPCCNVVGKQKVIGNVHNQDMTEIWKTYDKAMFSYCRTCKTPSPYAKRLNFFAETMNNG